jgi:hypothetical protein
VIQGLTGVQPQKPSLPFKYLPNVKGDSWEEVMKAVDKHDKELCEGWNKDVDTTLVFVSDILRSVSSASTYHPLQAGLFSATVTAFTIESYKWLSEDPADTAVRVLAQLSQQLGTANVTVNEAPFMVATAAIRINTFWFLSLIITLSAALIGILSKKWIQEYQRDAPISNQEAFEFRQLRRRSWEQWRVPDIICSTSLLLQLALLLFFAGVVDLLWSRVHVKVVATVITVAVGTSVLFVLVTIVLPPFYDLFWVVLHGARTGKTGWTDLIPCPYRSPLSRVLLSATRSMIYPLWRLRTQWNPQGRNEFLCTSNWSSIDLHLLRHCHWMARIGDSKPEFQKSDYLHQGMKWAVSTLGDNTVMLKHLFCCMESMPLVVDTLVPNALDFTPPHAFPRNQPRASAYAAIISLVRYLMDKDLEHFFIETALQFITATLPFIESAASSQFRTSSREIEILRLMTVKVGQRDPSDLPQGKYHSWI